MNNPLDSQKSMQHGVSSREGGQGWQHTFSASLDLRKFDGQLLVVDRERSKHRGRANAKYYWLAQENQLVQLFFGQAENFFIAQSFKRISRGFSFGPTSVST